MPKDLSINRFNYRLRSYVIGQACEFDYAGSQSARSIREGIEVILINSNPATIMTDPSMADHIYLKPLTKSIIEILKAHPQIDAVYLQWEDKQL
jgi:carbamoyl-phosphate synthase large subunit